MKYRKLPIVIEAFKLTNKNGTEQPEWILEAIESKEATVAYENGYFVGMDIKTPEGTMRANDGDYIIKGINGEIYPCKPDIFEKTYELADETAPKNKDLETIKAVVDNLTFSFEGTDEINMYDANAIADAAERMATAIELSDEISLKQTKRIEELENISNEFEKMVERNENKINELKAKFAAAKPITCSECINIGCRFHSQSKIIQKIEPEKPFGCLWGSREGEVERWPQNVQKKENTK